MDSNGLKVVRRYLNREPGADYRFVTSCLEGRRGDRAQHAAATALIAAQERDCLDDDAWIADTLIAAVESDERDDEQDARQAR